MTILVAWPFWPFVDSDVLLVGLVPIVLIPFEYVVLCSEMEKEQWVLLFFTCSSLAAAFLAYAISYRKEKSMQLSHYKIWLPGLLCICFFALALFIKNY